MPPVTVAPYGCWRSPLDPAALFERPSPPQYPAAHRGRYYWVETRSAEGGRAVLVQRSPGGGERGVTPEGFSVRTRVHEYGGRCYVFSNGMVYFSNDADGRLYVQPLDGCARPVPITGESGRETSFADLVLSPDGGHLLAVMERSRPDGDSENALAAIELRGGGPAEPVTVVSGADFYACPAVDRAGGRLSWIEWDHPDMPWDHTRLMVGAIRESEGGIAVDDVRNIAGEIDGSICQPAYYGADLVFAADRDEVRDECDDYWNLYRWSGRELRRLTCDPMEYGAPHWVFGDACHAPLEHDTLLARRVAPHGEELVEINRVTGAHRRIDCRFDAFSQMAPGLEKDEVVLVAASAVESARMVRCRRGGIETIKALPDAIPAEEISRGAAISFPTRDGGMAHAFYYAPHNTRYAAPAGQRPPLLVTVHGGPTARASGSLDLLRQYWTGSGFAVLDVNHRGSTGYGRRFRQQLLGRWGRMDVDDVIDGIDHLVGLSLVDPARIFIRGKSAGGYVVLRALTEYPQYFRGGTCYYGIGNLSTLASITHKFEARYTDRLIGERYDPQAVAKRDSEYFQRSPINFIDRLRSPMILFQGLDDRVVPPQASREVAAALAERKIEHQYVEYPGEGHGFRKSETNIDAINKETAFYRRVMGLTC